MNGQPGIEPVKIIARYADGKISKGYTHDFFPNKPFFHVHEASGDSSGEGTKVLLKELKAVFFVRDFEGDPSYDERKEFAKGQNPHGRKIEVLFKDGEKLVGTTTGYDPRRDGFFLFPVDPQSNNLRAYIISSAVQKVSPVIG